MKKWFILFTILAFVLCIGVSLSYMVKSDNIQIPEYPSDTENLQISQSPNDNDEIMEYYRLRDSSSGKIPPNKRRLIQEYVKTLPKRKASSLTQGGIWKSQGPENIGGRTRAFAIDVKDENVLIAGGATGGMWRSEDGGQSWAKTTLPDQIHSIASVVQDTRPGKTNNWYCATGEYPGAGSWFGFNYGDGIYKSEDNAKTWNVIPSTTSNTMNKYDSQFDFTFKIITNPTNLIEDEIYVAAISTIQRSIDGGLTWSKVLGTEIEPVGPPYYPGKMKTFAEIDIDYNGILYATITGLSDQKGIFRSIDGKIWINISPPFLPNKFDRTVIGIAPSDPNIIYFLSYTHDTGGCDHSLWKYTYLSGDGSGSGGKWEDRTSGLPVGEYYTWEFYTLGGYAIDIAVHPTDPEVVFIGGVNVYRSEDGFKTASNVKKISLRMPEHHVDQHILMFSPHDDNMLYSTNDGGIWKSPHFMQNYFEWIDLNKSYCTTQFDFVAIDQAGDHDKVIIGGTRDNGTLFGNQNSLEKNWTHIWGGDGMNCAISSQKKFYYTSNQYGAIGRQVISDKGIRESYEIISPKNGNEYVSSLPFILDPNDSKIMYITAENCIWFNNDVTKSKSYFDRFGDSDNWTKLNNTQVSSDRITALAVSKERPYILYYGTHFGKIFKLDLLDGRDDPPVVLSNGKGFPSSAYINCIAVDPTDADKVIAVFSNYNIKSLFYSEDGGESWADISGNLEENPDGSGNGPQCLWVEMLTGGDEDIYFVGTNAGLFSTNELKGTETVWIQEGADTIGNVQVRQIDARTTDGFVAVATYGNGIYSAYFENAAATIPENFVLKQNYPNPFNLETRIEFTLPKSSNVTVKIYNILGQEIKTILNTNRIAGQQYVVWDGTNNSGNLVSSGTYIYTVKTNSGIKAKRMTLVK